MMIINAKDDPVSDQPANVLELSIPDAAPFTSAPPRGEVRDTVGEQRGSTSMQFLTGNASEMGTPNMAAQRDFFEQYNTTERPPQLMPVEVDDAKSSQAKGTESLPGFDELAHIEDQQNRSTNFYMGAKKMKNGGAVEDN